MVDQFFGKEKISRILFKTVPPVMLAQLIQALYNIVDSTFIGRYSESGLPALSIIYLIQLLMIAIAVGSGVGVNTAIAHFNGSGNSKKAQEIAGICSPLACLLWLVFACLFFAVLPSFAGISTASPTIAHDVIVYGRIVCIGSFGLFFESFYTKVLQAYGDMKTPMIAQIVGALFNIVLDPILIFGKLGFPRLGIAGAAIATVIGQIAEAIIVLLNAFRRFPPISVIHGDLLLIYRLGIPNILMQSAYTFYILGLNFILSGFSDNAVTALGLYYKWQTFFFIPLGALQTCIVPILSYNYAARSSVRIRSTLRISLVWGMALMAFGTLCFECIPRIMLSAFTLNQAVLSIGTTGFRIIGIGFLPMVTSLIFPVFFKPSTGRRKVPC